MGVGSNKLHLTDGVSTLRLKDLIMVNTYGKLLLERIVHAIDKREILRPHPQTDNPCIVFDQFVVRTTNVVGIWRELVCGGQFLRVFSDGANRFRRVQAPYRRTLSPRKFTQNARVRRCFLDVEGSPLS